MNEISYPQYVTRKAMESLVEKLNLPELDESEQDWEYIVSNVSRISEFISVYENGDLNLEVKFALMIIIIDSYNDALWEGYSGKYHLINEVHIHRNTILYWAMVDDDIDLEDCFAVTPLMREVVKAVGI